MNRFCLLLAAFACAIAPLAGCASLSGNFFSPAAQTARYDDAEITTRVTSALIKKDASKANDVNVHCCNGHVFLVGEADKAFRAAALAAARQTEGVVHVTTHWFPTGTASTLRDAAIESAIDLSLFFSREHSPSTVNVDVWGGNVVLTGLADNQDDIDRALARIKNIPQVKSVTSYIELARNA